MSIKFYINNSEKLPPKGASDAKAGQAFVNLSLFRGTPSYSTLAYLGDIERTRSTAKNKKELKYLGCWRFPAKYPRAKSS
jgi:hypothetical protein